MGWGEVEYNKLFPITAKMPQSNGDGNFSLRIGREQTIEAPKINGSFCITDYLAGMLPDNTPDFQEVKGFAVYDNEYQGKILKRFVLAINTPGADGDKQRPIVLAKGLYSNASLWFLNSLAGLLEEVKENPTFDIIVTIDKGFGKRGPDWKYNGLGLLYNGKFWSKHKVSKDVLREQGATGDKLEGDAKAKIRNTYIDKLASFISETVAKFDLFDCNNIQPTASAEPAPDNPFDNNTPPELRKQDEFEDDVPF